MSNPVPSNLALTTINTGDTAQSAPLRNNFAAIQAAVNEQNACLGGGTSGQFLQAVDGTDVVWATTPGAEIGYDQITAPVNITGTSSATPTTVLTASAHTFDGSPVVAEFFSPQVNAPEIAGGIMGIGIWESTSLLAELAVVENVSATAMVFVPVVGKWRFTPSAGSHTYKIQAWVNSTTGTPAVSAGAAGNALAPAYLRFTKV